MEKIHLKLYVTGHTSRSVKAITNLREFCVKNFGQEFRLEIIDVLENPEAAEQEKILATPTLIKLLPPPMQRLIGDLSDQHKIIVSLDIKEFSNQ